MFSSAPALMKLIAAFVGVWVLTLAGAVTIFSVSSTEATAPPAPAVDQAVPRKPAPPSTGTVRFASAF